MRSKQTGAVPTAGGALLGLLERQSVGAAEAEAEAEAEGRLWAVPKRRRHRSTRLPKRTFRYRAESRPRAGPVPESRLQGPGEL